MKRVIWDKVIQYETVIIHDGIRYRLTIVRDGGVNYRLFRGYVDGMLAMKGRDIIPLKQRMVNFITGGVHQAKKVLDT